MERYKVIETNVASIRFNGGGSDSSEGTDEEHNGGITGYIQSGLNQLQRFNPFYNPFQRDGYNESDEDDDNVSKLTENHFSVPQEVQTEEDLMESISQLKTKVFKAETAEQKKELVCRLIELRQNLMILQENQQTPSQPEHKEKHVLGHIFVPGVKQDKNYYCDQCSGLILAPWLPLRGWFICEACRFRCHEKCLNHVTRQCASERIKHNPSYILEICPEKGLSAQNMKCAECKREVGFDSSRPEARLCDYTGLYYCDQCHWNDQLPTPARILLDWDFDPQKVCRASKQFLNLVKHKPIIRIQDTSPWLFNFVEELHQVKKLREEILIMKRYFLTCQAALKSKLLLQLKPRQHFVENSDMYSMQDVLDTAHDKLMPELAKIHSSFATHIKSDCESCRGKGFLCELCYDKEILFPFDNHATVCPNCAYVFHRHCFTKAKNKCTRCERIEAKSSSSVTRSSLSNDSKDVHSSPGHS